MTGLKTDIKGLIRHEAQRLGLDAVAVTSRYKATARLTTGAWPEARSVIMVGQSYAPESDPLEALADRNRAVVPPVYARGRDYHDVLKAKILPGNSPVTCNGARAVT